MGDASDTRSPRAGVNKTYLTCIGWVSGSIKIEVTHPDTHSLYFLPNTFYLSGG